VVPGASLAQLSHAARAAFPSAPYGLSLRTSLLAGIGQYTLAHSATESIVLTEKCAIIKGCLC